MQAMQAFASSYRFTSHSHELALIRAEGSIASSMLVGSSASITIIMTTASHVSCSPQHIQTRAESERRVMKTIIKRHAIWNRLLAATGQPTTVRTSLLSRRVTYGVAGRAMFDAPLVGEKS